ncbi:MAG TPA: flagellar biosynthesis anti-sigma factor FlgM [Edaphobacter sp.]|jgi:negative regulator of flagellin synthesis FlgM|nr:flagellar biosynthesis anti-sigma factor FlgM [Edaphobacter sp.]
MSYTSGIGNMQQALNSIASASKSTTDVSSGTDRGASALTSMREDQANLSSTGGVMAQALEGSDVRSAKVTTLQQAIASGSYNVSSSDVAEKMIDSLLK